MIFITNKYTRIYFSIIRHAQKRNLDGYKERHHIIPRSLGGNDSSENLVDLTAREHFICHKLLVKMTTGVARGKMAAAVILMAGSNGSRVYESTRKLFAKSMSELHRGKIPVTNGIVNRTIFLGNEIPEGYWPGFSDKVLKRRGESQKGKRWVTDGTQSFQIRDETPPEGFYWGQSDEHKLKNSLALSGDGNPMFGKFFITNGIENSVCDDELQIPDGWYKGKVEKPSQCKSKSKLGKKNPMFGKIPSNAKPIEIDGVKYKSLTEAQKKTGLSRRTVENLYKGTTL